MRSHPFSLSSNLLLFCSTIIKTNIGVSVLGTLRKHKLCGKTLVVVGQDILLLLVSRPTILLLLKDRTFQIWKRNSMSIDLIHEWFFEQKFEYLHNNPCQPHWQLATLSEDYKYNSASFYDTGEDRFGFLTHYSEI
jgi:hypothetical protein